MAKFCTKCGKKLEPGEVCSCQTGDSENGAAQMRAAGSAPGMAEQTPQPAPPVPEQKAVEQTSPVSEQASQQTPPPTGNQWAQGYGGQAPFVGNPGYGQQTPPGGGSWNPNYGSQTPPPAGGPGYGQQAGAWNPNYGSQTPPPAGGSGYDQQAGAWNPNYGRQTQSGAGPQNGQNMTREAEWFNEKKTMFVNSTKHMFSEILPVLKRPVGRLQEINASGNTAVGVEFIVAKAAAAFLLTLIALMWLQGEMGAVSDYVKIPYFQILLLVVVLTAGVDFLETVLLKVFTGIFNGRTTQGAMINTVGVRAMYDTFIIFLVVFLFLIAPEIAVIAAALCLPLVNYIEYAAYSVSVELVEDKKPYAFFVIKTCMTIIIALVMYLLARSMVSGAAGSLMRNIF